ncbi:DUF2956 domain-containing protein [Neptunomonas japonica]|uniref:DUF2956 domain-containing protein n=1 Tax=Neptunomonas japonica JAMM 1380 TaxID=1441457 RepID=A0A7R6SVM0_9GAMM|nr:DUF2956 domain-containing protein [Neptunomonas japonica]BBB29536.1 conserved hypothetical protein [Neptunomonas japonica JAMM 1380]
MSRQAKSTASDETKAEALKITRATQKQGQTKEQSKLIALGIQKGIDQYKKQQKSKARDLDRQKKKIKSINSSSNIDAPSENDTLQQAQPTAHTSKLPWILLLISWTIFAAYFWY